MHEMDKNPSDINNIKEHKLTRRRIMRFMAASGAGASTLANMSVEDVKASDSDQVQISFDTEGNHKSMVPADWYDRLRQARSARDDMEHQFYNKEGVISVGYSAGSFGGDNPHVLVGLDEDNKCSVE